MQAGEGPCGDRVRLFTDCMSQYNGDMGACQSYFDAMQVCRLRLVMDGMDRCCARGRMDNHCLAMSCLCFTCNDATFDALHNQLVHSTSLLAALSRPYA